MLYGKKVLFNIGSSSVEMQPLVNTLISNGGVVILETISKVEKENTADSNQYLEAVESNNDVLILKDERPEMNDKTKPEVEEPQDLGEAGKEESVPNIILAGSLSGNDDLAILAKSGLVVLDQVNTSDHSDTVGFQQIHIKAEVHCNNTSTEYAEELRVDQPGPCPLTPVQTNPEHRDQTVQLNPETDRLGLTEDNPNPADPCQSGMDQKIIIVADETDRANGNETLETIETLATSPIVCLRRALRNRDEKRDRNDKRVSFDPLTLLVKPYFKSVTFLKTR